MWLRGLQFRKRSPKRTGFVSSDEFDEVSKGRAAVSEMIGAWCSASSISPATQSSRLRVGACQLSHEPPLTRGHLLIKQRGRGDLLLRIVSGRRDPWTRCCRVAQAVETEGNKVNLSFHY